jgi:hypothetical protein
MKRAIENFIASEALNSIWNNAQTYASGNQSQCGLQFAHFAHQRWLEAALLE